MKHATKDNCFGIAFGSNLGDRLKNLTEAKNILLSKSSNPSECKFSSVYESEPVNCIQTCNTFLNATAEMYFDLKPDNLLKLCLDIELQFGRPKQRNKNEPRIIDLDILYAGQSLVESENLIIPHPELVNRRFVLEPLSKINPNLILPNQDKSIADLLNAFESPEPPLIEFCNNW